MGALPKALARRGHRTMVVAPRYSNYAEGWETGVRVNMRVMSIDVEVRRPCPWWAGMKMVLPGTMQSPWRDE